MKRFGWWALHCAWMILWAGGCLVFSEWQREAARRNYKTCVDQQVANGESTSRRWHELFNRLEVREAYLNGFKTELDKEMARVQRDKQHWADVKTRS